LTVTSLVSTLTELIPLLGVPRSLIEGGSGVVGPRHIRWTYRASHARTCSASLPAVVAHERHRGGNSTPLDIPVGDRSGPVTKIEGRIGIAVYPLAAARAEPDPILRAW
jgi:hypothetical protein